ncbi:hypothetical protein AB0H12_43715 [Actinosynnema sp. NPDC023794]
MGATAVVLVLSFAFNVRLVISRSVDGLAEGGHLLALGGRGGSSREDQVAVVRGVGQVGGGDQGELRRFRGEVYDCLDRRADALFDLVDGICAPVTVAGVAYLSLASGALCRSKGHRCWSSGVSVLVDEPAQDAGAVQSVGVEVVYRGGVPPNFGG